MTEPFRSPDSSGPTPAHYETISGRILIVDDSEYDRMFLTKTLNARGHHPQSVGTGEDALQALEAEVPFDLVLLDSRLPTYDGLEVLAMIRQKWSRLRLPVIMVTGWDHSEAMVEALQQGANDYVIKPVDPEVVGARIQTQLSLLSLMRQREEFLAFASHDLKNPLTVIIGYATVGTMQFCGEDADPELQQTFDKIAYNARYMSDIVNDFVDFHAIQEGRLSLDRELVAMDELLGEVISSNLKNAEAKGIGLTSEFAPGLPPIPLDETRISQVVQNLVSNAIKFCRDGCHITVKTSLHADASEVIIEVVDDGPGLTEEDQKKLFHKFAKLSARPTAGEKSSGLGLTICKRLVELHGGTMGAKNNAQGGSTFWFSLPTTIEEESASR